MIKVSIHILTAVMPKESDRVHDDDDDDNGGDDDDDNGGDNA